MRKLLSGFFASVAMAGALLLSIVTTDICRPKAAETLPWIKGSFWNARYSLYPFSTPQEHREAEYRRWLKVSVRIRNGNISGSGTVCYYDPQQKAAWVISCGHLFHGGEKTAEISVFYKNDTKLDQVQKFNANVIAIGKQEDISFMTFQPDWDLDIYAPIAKVDYKIDSGKTYYSCGCDGAREVACYLMKAVGIQGADLILVENAPRHGRSGGGLMTEDGWFIGICWGSTDPFNGSGKGMFVPLSRIHTFAREHNLGALLEVGMMQQREARKIPIINWTGPQRQFPADYVPIP